MLLSAIRRQGRELRVDVATLGAAVVTPQGFLRIPANLTRTGVLTYHRHDGRVVRELRHPDEVFNEDSLSTLRLAPVTDRHPHENGAGGSALVTPANVSRLQVGIVADAQAHGSMVAGELLVQTAGMIAKIKAGKGKELSPGYTVVIDESPGEWNGERYDVVQREIVYNHLAIGPVGWGRSGAKVALHTDSRGAGDWQSAFASERFDSERPIVVDMGRKKGTSTMETRTVRVDGFEVKVDTATSGFVEKAIADRDEKIKTLGTRADKAEADLVAMTKERDDAKRALTEATSPEAVRKLVDTRATLERDAAPFLPRKFVFDGKSDRDVKVAVLQSFDEDFDPKGRSDGYIDGKFDTLVEEHADEADDEGVRDDRDDRRVSLRKRARAEARGVDDRLDADDDEEDTRPRRRDQRDRARTRRAVARAHGGDEVHASKRRDSDDRGGARVDTAESARQRALEDAASMSTFGDAPN